MRYMVALLTFAFWLVFGTGSGFAEKTYIVSGNSYAPPVVWEEQNKLAGVAPDLIAEVFEELSIPYAVRIIENWAQVQEAAQGGSIDGIFSAFQNEKRDAYLNFSIPYLPEPSVVVVKKGNEFRFSHWDALKSKKGVAPSGESFGQEFDAYIEKNLDMSYYQIQRAMQELALGKADYLVIDYYTALVYTYLLQGENAVTILEPAIGTENFHFAISKDSELNARMDDINRVLGEKIAGGVVTELFMKHYERWKGIISRQSDMFNKLSAEQAAAHQQYMDKQSEMARQNIIQLMTDREGLPAAAH